PRSAYNPDHPPLGRLWLGVSSEIARRVAPSVAPENELRIVHARFGSATAYALTILLVGWVTARWYGSGAGLCAALALFMMPRVFGHAHLAALESVTNLFYTMAALAVASLWTGTQPPSKKAAIFCGILWGLAMLTKIQGVLLMVPVGLWGLCYWRGKSILPGVLFGLSGVVTLFVFWPWLWTNTFEHLQSYLGRTTDRSINKVYYLGEVWVDHEDPTVPELADYHELPWHYPLVMFLVTVPLGLQLLGLLGLKVKPAGRRFDGPMQVVLACMVFPLFLFCLPGVAVYDGTRLFLVSFPLWAIPIGRGGVAAWNWFSARAGLFGKIVWALVFFGSQLASMFVLHPCLLSYNNLGVGSVRGANALGFEPTYWADTLHRDFQKQVVNAIPPGSRVGLVPVLHQFQVEAFQHESLIFRAHKIHLEPFDPTFKNPPEYVMTFYRKADHSQQLTDVLSRSELLVEFRRQGVLLAALYRLKQE
ncbi:MAG TPA: glycosyltransferase family 39 protein, partial [Planctomycetaceae bacterium]|nr:glycosyltransferase family 39 protein [Planctomycetaceae bacterium]